MAWPARASVAGRRPGRGPGAAGRLMRPLALALLLGAPALPTALAAGAWPREVGGVFLSLRRDWERAGGARERSASAYGEYGLTERITLGGQWSDHSSIWTLPRAGGFLRVALGDPAAANRFAASLGLSTVPDMPMAGAEARLDLGLHWGRGFASRFGAGWATASYIRRVSLGGAAGIDDLSGTIGLRPRDGVMAMLSASRYRDAGGTHDKLAPALGLRLRDGVWAVGTYTHQVGGGERRALGLSLWLDF